MDVEMGGLMWVDLLWGLCSGRDGHTGRPWLNRTCSRKDLNLLGFLVMVCKYSSKRGSFGLYGIQFLKKVGLWATDKP